MNSWNKRHRKWW